jgi:hypothetical protein
VIAIIADTHMPRGARRLPERCLHAVHASGELAGFQIFNPGSPTERRCAPRPSMRLLDCDRSGLSFQHIWL